MLSPHPLLFKFNIPHRYSHSGHSTFSPANFIQHRSVGVGSKVRGLILYYNERSFWFILIFRKLKMLNFFCWMRGSKYGRYWIWFQFDALSEPIFGSVKVCMTFCKVEMSMSHQRMSWKYTTCLALPYSAYYRRLP